MNINEIKQQAAKRLNIETASSGEQQRRVEVHGNVVSLITEENFSFKPGAALPKGIIEAIDYSEMLYLAKNVDLKTLLLSLTTVDSIFNLAGDKLEDFLDQVHNGLGSSFVGLQDETVLDTKSFRSVKVINALIDLMKLIKVPMDDLNKVVEFLHRLTRVCTALNLGDARNAFEGDVKLIFDKKGKATFTFNKKVLDRALLRKIGIDEAGLDVDIKNPIEDTIASWLLCVDQNPDILPEKGSKEAKNILKILEKRGDIIKPIKTTKGTKELKDIYTRIKNQL